VMGDLWVIGWFLMLKQAAKLVILNFQGKFKLFPREICLISGAPRVQELQP